jgi:hypothetical protein
MKNYENTIKWYKKHPFSCRGYWGTYYPMIHADHAEGEMGRYELLVIIYPTNFDYLPLIRSVYYASLGRLKLDLLNGDYVITKGNDLWGVILGHPLVQKYPWIVDAEASVDPDWRLPGIEIEERKNQKKIICDVERTHTQYAAVVEDSD